MKEEIIKKLVDYIDASKDFVLEQAPEVFQQILSYEKMMSIIGLLSCSFFLLASSSFLYYFISNPKKDSYDCLESYSIVGLLISGSLSMATFIGLCVNMSNFICISTAPKYFLLKLILGIKS